MSCRPLAALVAAAIFALTSRSAVASVAVPASVEELARASSAVVRGRVVSASASWSRDHRRIDTRVEIEVVSAWRGTPPARLVVAVPGGEAGGLAQRVAGAPRLTPGEEVVLFLWGGGAGRPYRVTGLAQGKFEVSGARVRPDLSETGFVPRAPLRGGERRVEAMALDELERRVRSAR